MLMTKLRTIMSPRKVTVRMSNPSCSGPTMLRECGVTTSGVDFTICGLSRAEGNAALRACVPDDAGYIHKQPLQ